MNFVEDNEDKYVSYLNNTKNTQRAALYFISTFVVDVGKNSISDRLKDVEVIYYPPTTAVYDDT